MPSQNDGTVYFGQTSELQGPAAPTNMVILGELVMMSIGSPPNDPSDTYIPQPIRPSHRTDISIAALRSKPTLLHSVIHPALVDYMDRHPETRVILAADAMCKLAQKYRHKNHLLICNGYEATDHTHLDVYVFHHGQLTQVTESRIRESDHPRYSADVKEKLSDLTTDIPGAHILWTAPLRPIEIQGFPLEFIGPEIYQPSFPQVRTDGRTDPPSPKLPAIATAAVIALCAGWGAYDLKQLATARQIYDELSQNTPNTDIPIDVLRARADWQRSLDAEPPEQPFMPAEKLMAAIAQHPEWQLQGLQLSTRRAGEPEIASSSTTPLTMTLLLPDNTQTATEQAYTTVSTLATASGIRLTVRPQGLSTLQDNQQSPRLRIVVDMDQ